MSLEKVLQDHMVALAANTDATERLILAMNVEKPNDESQAKEPEKKTGAKKSTAKKKPTKQKVEPPVPKVEVVEPEDPTEEQTSMFAETSDQDNASDAEEAEVVEEEEQGSAPVSSGDVAPWYTYTMGICSKYSASTGDPSLTQALAAKHGISNMRDATDDQLYPLALEIGGILGIDVAGGES